MKIDAVIAEYNPFHTGHLYQLNTMRQKHHVDGIVVVMSGSFTQRGIPAIFDKYTRTRSALANGADLVLELPTFYSTSSAELFAYGAVSILHQLQIVQGLCFGSESADIASFSKVSDIFAQEPTEYKTKLQEYLKAGNSFPKARELALIDYCDCHIELSLSRQTIQQLCQNPNNILGMEYIKAIKKLHSDIEPYTILRKGSGYHCNVLPDTSTYASANAIRNHLKEGKPMQEFLPFLPEHSLPPFDQLHPIFMDDFFEILYYQLLSQESNLQNFYDISPSLANIIRKNMIHFPSESDFCRIIKSKEYTYHRIQRGLLHILLNMQQSTMDEFKNLPCPYAKILGFTPTGRDILSKIPKDSGIKLISKNASSISQTSGIVKTSLETDLFADTLYNATVSRKYHIPMQHEFSRQIIKVGF